MPTNKSLDEKESNKIDKTDIVDDKKSKNITENTIPNTFKKGECWLCPGWGCCVQ